MGINFTCSCGKEYNLIDDSAGRQVRCPACSTVSTVPYKMAAEQEPELVPIMLDVSPENNLCIIDLAEMIDDQNEPALTGSPAVISGQRTQPYTNLRINKRNRRHFVQIKINEKSIVSLVCGILGLALGVILAFISAFTAIIFGHIALSEIKSSDGRQSGDGMAIAGLVMGYVTLIGKFLFLYFQRHPI